MMQSGEERELRERIAELERQLQQAQHHRRLVEASAYKRSVADHRTITLWQGKFSIIRHENNALRRKLRRDPRDQFIEVCQSYLDMVHSDGDCTETCNDSTCHRCRVATVLHEAKEDRETLRKGY